MNAIEINGLKKSFGTVKAVDDISFKVKEGSLFAFLGELFFKDTSSIKDSV